MSEHKKYYSIEDVYLAGLLGFFCGIVLFTILFIVLPSGV